MPNTGLEHVKSGLRPGELLKTERELTRRSDELARRRRELPWVRIDSEYRFETDEGTASLADLFRGNHADSRTRLQLASKNTMGEAMMTTSPDTPCT
jgi:hypothetical protein